MERPLTEHIKSDGTWLTLKEYEKTGGYQGLKKALEMTPEEVLQEVKDSNPRGRGGGGFPTVLKWRFVATGEDNTDSRYNICNADEMEPSTFRDRLLLESINYEIF